MLGIRCCTEIIKSNSDPIFKTRVYRVKNQPDSVICEYCVNNGCVPSSFLIPSVEYPSPAKCKCPNRLLYHPDGSDYLDDQHNQDHQEISKKLHPITSKIICSNCINHVLQVTPIPGQCQECNNYLASCHNLYCGPCSWNHQKCSVCGTAIDIPLSL